MAATKRPQNKCKACGSTWFPRGKNLSNKCPNCGSKDVSVVWSWGGIAALLVVGGAIFSGNDKPKDAPAVVPTQTSITQTNEVAPVEELVVPVFSPNPEPSPITPEIRQQPAEALHIEKAADSRPAEPATKPSEHLTPTAICAHETSIFSRNSCEWRECEKTEFSALEECRHKRRKEGGFGG